MCDHTIRVEEESEENVKRENGGREIMKGEGH